jgi:hypothetical protein
MMIKIFKFLALILAIVLRILLWCCEQASELFQWMADKLVDWMNGLLYWAGN